MLRGVGMDWEVTDVELDAPHAGEVLVKMAYAGVCHSDEHFHSGDSVPSKDMEEMMRAAGVDGARVVPHARRARGLGHRRGGRAGGQDTQTR